jgi:tripartite-type tricarboxylate transporter receptor subunit TctC
MRPSRRQLLRSGACALALPALSDIARAQQYPARPVHVVTGFPAGSASDLAARLIGQRLSDRLGQPFVIDNRPGVAGNLAAEAVVRAPADGYTLLLLTTVNAFNATLYQDLHFTLARDIAPVASLIRGPGVMEVNASFPANSVPEFIAYAKANPGKINMATGGSGSMPDIYGALFMMMSGIELVRVPYRGTPPAVADLASGQVQVMFDTFAASMALIRGGQLRALAVTTSTRSAALPDVPALCEFLPGYDASLWLGVGAPKGTPPEAIETLNTAINSVLAEPSITARFAELGYATYPNSPAEFGTIITRDIEKWAKVIEFAGIKAE